MAATYQDRLLEAARAHDEAKIMQIIVESNDANAHIGPMGADHMLGILLEQRDIEAFKALLTQLRRTLIGKDWQPSDAQLTSLIKDRQFAFLSLLFAERLDLERVRKIAASADSETAAKINALLDAVELERKDIGDLIEACRKGDTETVTRLLDAGVNVNARSSDGNSWTPLTRAAAAKKADIVSILLKRGAEVDLPKHPGWDYTPLCLTSSVEVANHLKAAGADIHAKLFERDTEILTYVAKFGGAEMVQWFIAQGADPKMIGDNDQTLLFYVKDAATAKILLDAGVDPNRPDEFGRVALQLARSGDIVRLFVEKGAKVTGFKTPLIIEMVSANSGDAIDAVIEAGAEADPATLQKALIATAHTDRPEAAKALIKHGAKANEESEWNPTAPKMYPLLMCCIHGSPKTARVFLENGADPNAGEFPGQMLRTAIHNNEKEMVEILRAAGARGASELTLAIATNDRDRIAKLLTDAPTYAAQPDFWEGAFTAAAERGNLEVVQAAIAKKAPLVAASQPSTRKENVYASAAFEGQWEVLDILLKTRTPTPEELQSALWSAVWNSQPYNDQRPAENFEKCVDLLLALGPVQDPEPTDESFPFMATAIFTRNPGGNPNVITKLAQAGYNPNPRMRDGKLLSELLTESCTTPSCSRPSESVLAAYESMAKITIPRSQEEQKKP